MSEENNITAMSKSCEFHTDGSPPHYCMNRATVINGAGDFLCGGDHAELTGSTEPVTIHTLAATVAKFKALKEAANKAMTEAEALHHAARRLYDAHGNSHQKAQMSLLDFIDALDAGLSAAPSEPVETFDGAGAKA